MALRVQTMQKPHLIPNIETHLLLKASQLYRLDHKDQFWLFNLHILVIKQGQTEKTLQVLCSLVRMFSGTLCLR